MFAAGCALAVSCLPASAQTAYTWNGTSGGTGAWNVIGNWTPTSQVPGGIASTGTAATTTDTATITQSSTSTSALELVTLGNNETISSLTLNQTSTGTVELRLGGTVTSTLTVSSTFSLGGNSTGTELLYLDAIDNTKTTNYTGNITVGTHGVIEMGSTNASPSINGSVTLNAGSVLNADLTTAAGASVTPTIAGALTLSGGTINLGTANSSGVLSAASTADDTRFTVTGNFLATSGTIALKSTTGTATGTGELFLGGGISTAQINSGVSVSGITGIEYTGTNLGASAFSLTSDAVMPSLTIAPTGSTTGSAVVNVSIGSVTAGGTLNLNGNSMSFVDPTGTAGGKTGNLEVTLTSNVSSGNIVVSSPHAGTVLINLNGNTLDQSSYSGQFGASTIAAYSIQGTGTLKATSINLNTGTGTVNVNGAATLWMVGGTSGTGTALVQDSSSLAAGSGTIDPTSTFKYTGTGTTSGTITENGLVSNRAIGRLLVGDGTHGATLDIINTTTLGATANTLGVGGDVTVSASGTLDLAGQNLVETAPSGATNGGLNGAGTVLNGTAITGTATALAASTMTLNATASTGSFSGLIEDHASGGGTGILSVVLAGTGTQTISSANTYSGGTTISGGVLAVTNSTGTATGTGTVTVGGQSGGAATATLRGTGTVAGLVTSSANSNVGNITPGTAGTVGTLHVGTLGFTIGSGTNFNYDINTATTAGGTSNDLISMNGGTLTIGGSSIVFNFNQLSSLSTSGTYTLISGATSIASFNASDFSATGIGTDTATFADVGNNLVVSFSPSVTATTGTYTLTTTAGASVLHAGASTTLTTTLANTGTGTADSLNVTGLGAASTGGTINNGTVSSGTVLQTGTLTNTGQTFTASTAGSQTVTGTATSVVGDNGTGTATLASNTGASVFVYSGAGVWTTSGGGSWGTTPTATPANWQANGGIPGITPGFTTTDSASFGDTGFSGTATVTLDGATPFLNAITFNNGNGSYNIAQGTGSGMIHLDSTGTATITDTLGNHTISAPVELDSATAVSVASSSTLTISGNISQSGTPSLAISGPGTTILSGSNTYSGGTSLASGSLLLSNTSGSATGLGALNVAAGATLGGYGSSSGSSFSIGATGSRTTVLVGMNSASDTNTVQSLTLMGSGANSITNTTLQFNISAATAGQGTELSVGTSSITFSNSTLALNVQGVGVIQAYSPYVLIAGTGTNQYSGLTTQLETINGQSYDVIIGGLGLSFAPSQANTWYATNSFLYLNTAGGADDIEVDVVPEPGTWAMMLGGLAILLFWQRRRSRAGRS